MLAKTKLDYQRLLVQMPKKTSNLSPQVKKNLLLKESVAIESESTAKVAWSAVKPNTPSTPPVESQNPSNSLDGARSEMKRGKTTKKKT